MRIIPCTFVAIWLIFQSASPTSASVPIPLAPLPIGGPTLNEELIKLRFRLMNTPFEPVYDRDVSSYLRRYLTYGQKETELMLGRAVTVFPIFEHYLEMHGLPMELKYLPMIESSLVPYATSVSGAAGLWQFMPSTGRAYGLTIDSYLDERRDPYRSTEAAVKYLKKLYNRFGKWELALAAYNCGPTRLSRVIRTQGSNDFWQIKHQLPRETQRYVCRYMAACYIGTYYKLHGLQPIIPPEYELKGMAARIYSPVSLTKISRMTGVEIATLRQLNPAFKQNYSPARANGIFLVLPQDAWYGYLEAERRKNPQAAANVKP